MRLSVDRVYTVWWVGDAERFKQSSTIVKDG